MRKTYSSGTFERKRPFGKWPWIRHLDRECCPHTKSAQARTIRLSLALLWKDESSTERCHLARTHTLTVYVRGNLTLRAMIQQWRGANSGYLLAGIREERGTTLPCGPQAGEDRHQYEQLRSQCGNEEGSRNVHIRGQQTYPSWGGWSG